MDGSEVVAWLRGEPDANAVEVVGRLLNVGRARLEELRARWADRRFASAATQATRDVERALRARTSLRLDALALATIADVFEAAAGNVGIGLSARAVAAGVDAALGPRFGAYFDADDERRLAPGDPFPIHAAPTLTLVGKGDSPGNPDNLTPPLLRTQHLGILGDTKGIPVYLRSVGARLRPPRSTSTVATIATNGRVAEFAFDVYDHERRSVDRDADWSGGRGYFYNVRPGAFGADDEARRTAIEEQKKRIEGGLRRAAHARCEIVVLPECSATDEIHAWVMQLDVVHEIPLLVLGSRHVATESGLGPGRNESTVLLRGRDVARVSKFADFNCRLPEVATGIAFYEDLDRVPAIHLLVGASASVIVVICKDAFNADVVEVVRTLSPTFLLVPTMSEELKHFESVAEQLALHPQVITVAANVGPVASLVGRPSLKNTVVTMPYEVACAVQCFLATGRICIL